MAWDFSTEPEFAERLVWMRNFIDEEVMPIDALQPDRELLIRLMAPLKARVKEAGLWAAHLPPELGGQGFGQLKLGLMNEIIGRTKYASIAFGNQAPDSGNAEILARWGTEEQRTQWLTPLLAGDIRSAFAMTEPGAGADPTLLSTTATMVGDEWRLNGHKWFITNASFASFLIVMAVTEDDAPPHARATMFIVPSETPGVNVVRDIPSMEDPVPGANSFETHCEVVFDDVRIPAAATLGAPGQGFSIAQDRLGPGRIHHCMRWLGQAQRALDMMCSRSLSRYVHGSLLADKQTVQNWIADSVAELQAARLLTLRAAWLIDQSGSRSARLEISAIKFFGARVLHDIVDRAIQVHGSLGFSSDMPLEEMYRRARAARFYDGPDEVHRATVARLTLRAYEATAPGEHPAEHLPTRRCTAAARFHDLLAQHQ